MSQPNAKPLRRFRRQLRPKLLIPSIAAGLVAGLIDIPIEISCAALIFSGALAGYVAGGIGLALFGCFVIGTVVALTSSYRGTVALPQESPAAILALVAAAIVASMPASATSEDTFFTVVAAIAITSLLAGVFFLVVGWCKLGSLIRYIPYPVVGGFLAGTGWLLVSGAMRFLTDLSLSFSQLPTLFGADVLLRWLPALIFGVVLLVILRHHDHCLILPAMLLAAIVLFYGVLWLTGTSLAEAGVQGWLLGPFPEGALWQPLTPSAVDQVYWPAIFGQAGSVAIILFISAVSLLLNTSALELTVGRDIELNRELRSAGLANLLAGLGSGLPGYQTLGQSALSHRMRAHSRLVGITTATLCGVALVFGARVLSYFPKPIVGGLLLYLGLTFLVEWLYDAWFKLSRAEYAIVVLILAVIMAVGVLEGVGLGLVLAVVLFVVSYSRISVVKHTLSGSNYRSNVDRRGPEAQILRDKGDWLYVLELQGFIFFGTANRVLDQVRGRMADPGLPALHFVALDFRQVNGLDASAVLSFVRMKQLVQTEEIVLVFTHLTEEMKRSLSGEVLTEEDRGLWRIESDLDHGLEWCEEQMLRLAEGEEPSVDDRGRPADIRPGPIATPELKEYVERMEVPQGQYLIHQGDAPGGLYFIEAGQVTAQRECNDGSVIRLRKMGAGTVVGEMGLYLGTAASASVVTNQPSTVYYLSAEALEQMEETKPEMAAAFHRYIAQLLGERLARANDTLQALLEEPQPRLAAGSTTGGLSQPFDSA
jgi:SulP family sulfate permease